MHSYKLTVKSSKEIYDHIFHNFKEFLINTKSFVDYYVEDDIKLEMSIDNSKYIYNNTTINIYNIKDLGYVIDIESSNKDELDLISNKYNLNLYYKVVDYKTLARGKVYHDRFNSVISLL